MVEVRLRLDFYGNLIPKFSLQNLVVSVSFDYKGPAQMLTIETSTGKKGIWGDYDQESPTYSDSKQVFSSVNFMNYTFMKVIPLSFWGNRKINDGAVEVVIRGQDVYQDAVLWNAYTINL